MRVYIQNKHYSLNEADQVISDHSVAYQDRSFKDILLTCAAKRQSDTGILRCPTKFAAAGCNVASRSTTFVCAPKPLLTWKNSLIHLATLRTLYVFVEARGSDHRSALEREEPLRAWEELLLR